MPSHGPNSTAVLPSAAPSDAKDRKNNAADKTLAQASTPASRSGGEERRRSQRVLLRIQAQVHVNLKGQKESIGVHTLSVNPFGAMMISPRNLPTNSRLVLEHTLTRERVACRVVRAATEVPEGFHVPVEFDMPAPGFWKIDFPPEDWKVHDDL